MAVVVVQIINLCVAVLDLAVEVLGLDLSLLGRGTIRVVFIHMGADVVCLVLDEGTALKMSSVGTVGLYM
jgi:hypothetical protein